MFKHNLIENPSFRLNEKTIDYILKVVSDTIKKSQKWILNIVFLDESSIKSLNNNYRNIDKSTDVLSFHYYDDFENLNPDDTAWEIIMSEEKVKSQWIEYWLWEEKEFYKLLIHSVLHILWYDHETDDDYIVMQELEEKIWKEVFEK